jgi:hypothetical protein
MVMFGTKIFKLSAVANPRTMHDRAIASTGSNVCAKITN